MNPDELQEILDARPFKPLRLYLNNGQSHEIRHPETAKLGEEMIALEIPNEAGRPRWRFLALMNITEIEPADQPAR